MRKRVVVLLLAVALFGGTFAGRASNTVVVPADMLEAEQRQALALERIAGALEAVAARPAAIAPDTMRLIEQHLRHIAKVSGSPFSLEDYPPGEGDGQ